MHTIPADLNKVPLFHGIEADKLNAMLKCIGYHISSYKKGENISFEEEHVKYIGIVLSGSVDMVKEDLWGNKTIIARMHANELFGEAFACGSSTLSIVTVTAAEKTKILFLPFQKVMHTCNMTCVFHHRLIENMVRLIADKNQNLMRKVEIISKKTLREKILAYLSLQAQLHDSRYFRISLNRAELADYLCAERSALSRELSRMKEDGLIDYDQNMFRIL